MPGERKLKRRSKKNSETEEIERTILSEDAQKNSGPSFVHSGSTLLNLVCSDSIKGGFVKGSMINVIGDSHTGKTILALTCLAEVSNRKRYDDYLLFYDDAENACNFNIKKLLGNIAFERITFLSPPSFTIEQWADRVRELLKEGKKFIYVLDSLDALTSESEVELLEKQIKERARSGVTLSESYGTEKAKAISQMLRTISNDLKQTESLLYVISQVRENIGARQFMPRYRRSGGKALDHYSQHVFWLATKEVIKSSKRNIPIGQLTQIKCTKNKVTGKIRSIEVPIYYSYGVDDIGSMINFLMSEGRWKRNGGIIHCPELNFNGTKNQLIQFIEDSKHGESKLKKIVWEQWNKIESELELGRKSKYDN